MCTYYYILHQFSMWLPVMVHVAYHNNKSHFRSLQGYDAADLMLLDDAALVDGDIVESDDDGDGDHPFFDEEDDEDN